MMFSDKFNLYLALSSSNIYLMKNENIWSDRALNDLSVTYKLQIWSIVTAPLFSIEGDKIGHLVVVLLTDPNNLVNFQSILTSSDRA